MEALNAQHLQILVSPMHDESLNNIFDEFADLLSLNA
jgi:hypothetical protein